MSSDLAFDDRLVTLSIDIPGENGAAADRFTYDQNLSITATGTKYTDGNFGEFAVRIDNIDKKVRDYLVNRTSLWTPQRTNAAVSLSVGRASYGTFQLCTGNAIACNPTQPPDIGLYLRSLSLSAAMGAIGAFTAPPNSSLRDICGQVAAVIPNPLTGVVGVPLVYLATINPLIGNYHFNGAVPNQIRYINTLAPIKAYFENSSNTFVVRDLNGALIEPFIEINRNTGLIGVPEVTEIGARCRVLIRNDVRVGDSVHLESVVNPAVNGNYEIVRLSFEIASRDTPFYWIMDLRAPLSTGIPNG